MPVRERSLVKEFKAFLLRGNVVDLAVAVVVGAAFGAVVSALVKDLITPIITAIIGKPDFGALTFTIHKSRFFYGDFINALVVFVSIAGAVFFLVVKPVNFLMSRRRSGAEPESEASISDEAALLTEIRDLLRAAKG